jgi:hypothetical protein
MKLLTSTSNFTKAFKKVEPLAKECGYLSFLYNSNKLYFYVEKSEFDTETEPIPIEIEDNIISNVENTSNWQVFTLINENELEKLTKFVSEITQESKIEIVIVNNINKPLKGGEILLKTLDKTLKIEFVN